MKVVGVRNLDLKALGDALPSCDDDFATLRLGIFAAPSWPEISTNPDLQLLTGSGQNQVRFDHVAVWALTRTLVEFDIAKKRR
jgi:hypothetical protein